MRPAAAYGPNINWGSDPLQQTIDRGVKFLPWCLAVALVAHDDGITGVKALVQHVAAGEFRTDQVPGELVELETIDGVERGRRPPALEALLELGIGDKVDARRHLQRRCARKRAQRIDDLGVVLLAPVEGGVQDPPIGRGVAVRPLLVSLDLSVHEPTDGRLEGGKPSQRFAHARNFVDAVRLAHPAREPDDQSHLGPEPHVRLLVLVTVRRRLDVDAPRHRSVVMQEDAVPRHLDAVADRHRVALVEPEAERIVGLVAGVALVRLARPE